jgi:alpha-tubulin suppressor-like RCC1 family protein
MTFDEISATGDGHVCAIATDGRVFCWGRNDHGQLGMGVAVATPTWNGLRATSVATGGAHTCTLDDRGIVRCFGWNAYGQLGDGSTADNDGSSAGVAEALIFRSVSAGGRHTCGISADRRAYCWGLNQSGQLGEPDLARGQCVSVDGLSTKCSTTPVAVRGGLKFVSLAAGDDHSCGVTIDNSVFCWGLNDSGQLGSHSPETCAAGVGQWLPCGTVPRPVASRLAFRAVAAGSRHTCALTLNGEMYCWGSNARHQLGPGADGARCQSGSLEMPCSETPMRVESPGVSFVALTAGGAHTCGVTERRTTLCWGDNELGQIGRRRWVGQAALGRAQSPDDAADSAAAAAAADTAGAFNVADAAGAAADRVYIGGKLEAAYLESQVERPALPLPGNPVPPYPKPLRRAAIDGEVVAQFVVDTAGTPVAGTFKVLRSSHPLFTSAVWGVAPRLRFEPAELHPGRKVAQVVQQHFHFEPRRAVSRRSVQL